MQTDAETLTTNASISTGCIVLGLGRIKRSRHGHEHGGEMAVGVRPVKVDRDEVFVELTKSVCPVCRRVLDAEVNIRDGCVYLRRTCPEHGRFEALTCSDAEWYMASLREPLVNSVVFQPVTNAGRHRVFDPLTRLTNPDVMRMIAEQVPEWFRRSDFVPVPCCFPTCRSVTYALVDGETVLPLPRLVDVESHFDYVSNRMIPDASVLRALEHLWSASAVPGSAMLADDLACATCAIDIPAALADLRHRAFMLVVQDFQDAYTLNVRQLKKCCVAELTPDGRQIPFCAYNSVGYREQVRSQLTGVPVELAVPNAISLRAGLRRGVNGSTVWGDT